MRSIADLYINDDEIRLIEIYKLYVSQRKYNPLKGEYIIKTCEGVSGFPHEKTSLYLNYPILHDNECYLVWDTHFGGAEQAIFFKECFNERFRSVLVGKDFYAYTKESGDTPVVFNDRVVRY